MHTHIHTITSI